MDTKDVNGHLHIEYKRDTYDLKIAEKRSDEYYKWLDTRRTIRDISSKPISKKLIENLIKASATAPSGANKQPWTFCAVSSATTKKAIRKAAEKEEYESYNSRMTERWLKDLAPIGTDWKKPFLEEAPWLIIVFKKAFEMDKGEKANNYYVNESVGIACGMLISAIHHAGLVTLTHTPSPMNFLTKILKRPDNERPFLLLPIGYPKNEVFVPDLKRKALNEIAVFYEHADSD